MSSFLAPLSDHHFSHRHFQTPSSSTQPRTSYYPKGLFSRTESRDRLWKVLHRAESGFAPHDPRVQRRHVRLRGRGTIRHKPNSQKKYGISIIKSCARRIAQVSNSRPWLSCLADSTTPSTRSRAQQACRRRLQRSVYVFCLNFKIDKNLNLSFLSLCAKQLPPILAIIDDASDPDFTPAGFASRLQQMGIVDPNPTFSPSSRAGNTLDALQHGGMPSSAAGPIFPSSRANLTLSALASRRAVQERADADMERFQQVGIREARRRYVDMRTLADALQLLDKGVAARDVENRLGMEAGLLRKLGPKGVLTHLAN